MTNPHLSRNRLRVGMVGLGMIFDETYRPLFEQLRGGGLYRNDFGHVAVELTGVASRTGSRAERIRQENEAKLGAFASFIEPDAAARLVEQDLQVVCVATPDDRHFEAARLALSAGRHVLIEKPSVLALPQLDVLLDLARQSGVLAKVVYHKLADPDHKKLRTHVADGILRHVNNGYCSLAGAEIDQRRAVRGMDSRTQPSHLCRRALFQTDRFHVSAQPGTCRASGRPASAASSAQPMAPTWDSVQTQIVYTHADGREAAFDIHTSWVTPDNFPGYVEQEVQFRFDNGVWNAHQRKRGVELTVEGRTPSELKITPNHHYNGMFRRTLGRAFPTRLRDRDSAPILRGSRLRRIRRAGRRTRGSAPANERPPLQRSERGSKRGGDRPSPGSPVSEAGRRLSGWRRRSKYARGWTCPALPGQSHPEILYRGRV